ncbi:hypothetical protein ACH41H_48535 [Streptomyces sp. NPDC020800]|uniref:hypothetical protein n=1 Tax=Streptomyces sp. NPDC020800 TaxID=3365092 RepID=UPI0037989AC1
MTCRLPAETAVPLSHWSCSELASSDRAYYTGFQIWNGGQEACYGWSGWDFSGHQVELTYARCDMP